ncbi:MAG: hypothetical protein ACRDKI_01830 [Solirubrobacterales bacterium]
MAAATEPSLPEKLLATDRALTEAKLAHAFGGAIALAYYAEPRATIDIDINVFAAASEFERIAAALEPLGVDTATDRLALERDGQCRLRWGRTPIDLFFSYADLHAAMIAATRRVPFADSQIDILSPDHLIVCKAVFDRPKDWLDIEQMLVVADGLHRDEIERWIAEIVGEDSENLRRFSALADELLG